MSDGIWSLTRQYEPLVSVLDEQANFDEAGNYILKPRKELSSSLQNPSYPDATFRSQADRSYKGSAGNFVETVGDTGLSFITDFDSQEKTYRDSAFAKDQIQIHRK